MSMSLFDLPREIRDEVYGHIFDAPRYITPNQLSLDSYQLAKFDILRTSKQVSNEASRVLYSTGSFEILLNSHAYIIPNALFSPRTTHLIQDVVIDISIEPYNNPDSGTINYFIAQHFEDIITRSLGMTRARKTCRILVRRQASARPPHFVESAFIETCKRLVDFEAVTVRFEKPIGRLRVPYNNLMNYVNPNEETRTRTRSALEPFLGPGTFFQGDEERAQRLLSSLRFRPRENLAETAAEGMRESMEQEARHGMGCQESGVGLLQGNLENLGLV